jgi:hypothetical protein
MLLLDQSACVPQRRRTFPKFFEGLVDKLVVPARARNMQTFDDELPGSGIRKFRDGYASYFVKFNLGRQQRRKTLGKAVRANLKQMRLMASEVLANAPSASMS